MIKRISLFCLIIVIGLISSCSAMFPVHVNDDLSQSVLLKSTPINKHIALRFHSNLPDNYETEFDPVSSPQAYNVNQQVENMLKEYVEFKSNDGSSESINLKVTILQFKTFYKEVGGGASIVLGTNDVERGAVITVEAELFGGAGKMVKQKIVGKKVIRFSNMPKGKYSSWMAIYTDAINQAVNNAIIKLDGIVDSSI